MTTLSTLFLLSVVLETVPNAVEEAKLRHAGQPIPDELKGHPNNQDSGRLQLGQLAYAMVVDRLILDLPEDHTRIYDAFGVSDENRKAIEEARVMAAVTLDELQQMRRSVAKIEQIRNTLPEMLWKMMLPLKEEFDAIVARYNAVGTQLGIISNRLVGASETPQPEAEPEVEEVEEVDLSSVESTVREILKLEDSPELRDAIARAREVGGSIAVELRAGKVTVLGEGDFEAMAAMAEARNAELEASEEDEDYDAEAHAVPVEGLESEAAAEPA